MNTPPNLPDNLPPLPPLPPVPPGFDRWKAERRDLRWHETSNPNIRLCNGKEWLPLNHFPSLGFGGYGNVWIIEAVREPAKGEACPTKHCANCDISAQWSTADCPICFGHLTERESANEPAAGELPPPVDPAIIIKRIRAKEAAAGEASPCPECYRWPAPGEQAAFQNWLASNCPSGDAESVHRQWRESSDYLDFANQPTGVEARVCGWRPIESDLPAVGDLIACMAEHKDGGMMLWAGTVVELWEQGFTIMETRGEETRRFVITHDTMWTKLPPPAERRDHEAPGASPENSPPPGESAK